MKNLDLLRAIAVLCVFTSHFIECFDWFPVGSLGRFGVVLFFVHTSLVLMSSLTRMEKSGAGSSLRLAGAFYLRRLFRIYPLAVFTVLLIPLLHIPIYPNGQYVWVGTKAYLSNLALTQNLTFSPFVLAPLWSLPLEVQMYVILPFAYFAIRNHKYRSLALWVLSVILALTVPRIIGRLSVLSLAPCFTSGIVAFDFARFTRPRLPAWTFPVALLAIIALFNPLDDTGLSIPWKLPLAWVLSLAVAFVIVFARDGAWLRIHPLTRWIAEHSYGVYLSHTVISWFAFFVMKSSPLWSQILIVAVLAVGVPALLYRFIENPLIRFGVQLADSVQRPQEQVLKASAGSAG